MRRARWELRLASALVAVWAILATTAFLWMLGRGDVAGITRRLSDPQDLLGPDGAGLWMAGVAVAFGILTGAFVLNQLVGRAHLIALAPTEMDWPSRLPRPTTRTTLARFERAQPEAFGFALIEPVPGHLLRWRRREVILLSRGLLDRLEPAEVEAVVAHELGHLRALDGRYLTFLRTLARLVRWDPVFAILSRSLTRREELRADAVAAELTGRPATLALALYKVSLVPGRPFRPLAAQGLLGPEPGSVPATVDRRIRRLLERAAGLPVRDA